MKKFARQSAKREPLIHLAFRFHGNFYHSYRGDTPDERGFGKDIRIVRHILRELDSVNDHVTNGWAAVSNGATGLLIAQQTETGASMAFCPMRTRCAGGHSAPAGLRVRLNPFGTYDGRQYRYPTARSGLGRFSAVNMSAADHIHSSAPSFNGITQEFALLLCPYHGDAPPPELQLDAMTFAYGLGYHGG